MTHQAYRNWTGIERCVDPLRPLMRELLKMPALGTPAADLTDREKMVIARLLGAPVEVFIGEDGVATLTTTCRIAIEDVTVGAYRVRIAPAEPCEACGGRGQYLRWDIGEGEPVALTCPTCKGSRVAP